MRDNTLRIIVEQLICYLAGCEREETADQISLHDPIAGRVIGSHYSLSHYFGALFLQAYITGNPLLH